MARRRLPHRPTARRPVARSRAGLWLRWSWRDLRSRWALVTAIALIIALGTGTFAGLGSTATWRRQSNDESFSLLRMHDLRVSLAQGATAPEGSLAAAADELPHAEWVTGRIEHLVGRTQVDASTSSETILTAGKIVGLPLGPDTGAPATGDPDTGGTDATDLPVDALHVAEGRTLRASDATPTGEPTAVLEQTYADHFELPSEGTLTVSGGRRITYVGTGTSPQYFIVTGEQGLLFAQASLATLFAPLPTAQELLGQPGQVNELVLTTTDGADVATLERELAAALPGVGLEFTRRADEPVVRMLYEDIDNDQQFWNVIAGLVLAGATFAAFNLTSRMIDAQRRQLGVGMAFGTPPGLLALRPLLVGVQIAALGVVAGIAVGYALDIWLAGVFESVLPLPVWRTGFQPLVFARAAALGFVLPVIAAAIPVWRAVRVEPVDAIRTGHLAPTRKGLTGLGSRLRLPGGILQQMPLRDLLRSPRRTLLTALAIGAAITTMIATIGLLDSFVKTLERGEAEAAHGAPDRFLVELQNFSLADGPEVSAIGGRPEVAEAEPRLRLFGTAGVDGGHDDEVDLLIDLIDFDHAMWTPTLTAGSEQAIADGGLVLSEKAAQDLGVGVGDRLAVRHPRREGLSYRLVTSELTVGALHASPVRAFSYLDSGQAPLFDLAGLANLVDVRPAPGVSDDELIRAIASQEGVASVISVAGVTRQFREAMEEFFGVLRVVEVVVLLLAVLIAFNASSIGVDEQARQNATMLAFGLQPRAVLAVAAAEMAAIGVIGTALGLLGGRAVMAWVTEVQMQKTMPDVAVEAYVSPTTLVTAVVLGVVAVAAAPLLLARRVRHMDIPSTLRVLE